MAEQPRAMTLDLSVSAAPARDFSATAHLEAEVVTLFDELRDRLVRYVLSLGVPGPDAEEIVQEAFLALFQHLRRGKSHRNLRGWLFQVVHNLAGMRLRHGYHRIHSTDANGGEILVADPAPSPEALASSNQAQAHLLGVLRVLPERDRRCLTLRAEGLRYREIAQVLDMSLGAVSLSLVKTLSRLARVAER